MCLLSLGPLTLYENSPVFPGKHEAMGEGHGGVARKAGGYLQRSVMVPVVVS